MSVYLYRNNQQDGPYEESVVWEWLQAGNCSADDLAIREGMAEWQPLSRVLGFQEPFYGITYLALVSIGDIVDEDLSRFNVAINRMKLFNGITTELAEKYHETMQPYVDGDADAWEEFISAAASSLPSELRETAFAISCDLVMRNGFVPPKADGYLEMLQQRLGVEDNLAKMITAVIQIKNRG